MILRSRFALWLFDDKLTANWPTWQENFLADLQEQYEGLPVLLFGKVFLDFAPYFRMYTVSMYSDGIISSYKKLFHGRYLIWDTCRLCSRVDLRLELQYRVVDHCSAEKEKSAVLHSFRRDRGGVWS